MTFVFLSHGLVVLKAFALCITPCMMHASARQPPPSEHKESTRKVSAVTHQACPRTGFSSSALIDVFWSQMVACSIICCFSDMIGARLLWGIWPYILPLRNCDGHYFPLAQVQQHTGAFYFSDDNQPFVDLEQSDKLQNPLDTSLILIEINLKHSKIPLSFLLFKS